MRLTPRCPIAVILILPRRSFSTVRCYARFRTENPSAFWLFTPNVPTLIQCTIHGFIVHIHL